MSGEAPTAREALTVYAVEAPETEIVPPGYRQTEVGVIPEDWEVGNLASLGSGSTLSIKAGPFGSALTKATYVPRGYKVYGQEQVIRGDYQYGNYFVPYAKFKEPEGCSVKPGDILLSLVGTAGKLLVIPQDASEGIINPRLIRFSFDKQRVDSKFFKELFESNQVQSYLKRYAQGGTMDVLNASILRAVHIPLPPLPEQRAIAAALSDVDCLIAALDKLIAKKRAVKIAAMQQLLTGKQRLPGFGGEWETRRFSELASPRRERTDPRKSGLRGFCVELEHIESGTGRLLGTIDGKDQSSLKSVFQAGDVLFGKLRPYLRKYWLADRSGICSTEIWALAADRFLITPEFLFQTVRVSQFIETASTAYGTHMPRSDWNVVKNYEVAVPSLKEQTAITTVLSDMDAEIEALEARREKTRQIKQGMMQELLTGRTRLFADGSSA